MDQEDWIRWPLRPKRYALPPFRYARHFLPARFRSRGVGGEVVPEGDRGVC